MTRRARHRPHRMAAVNSLDIAINGARKLAAADVAGQRALLERAETELRTGRGTWPAWCALADAANMAETFAAMGLGAGPEADDAIDRAQQALAEIHHRQAQRGTWTLYADEIDALHWLVRVHVVQLEACSYCEFSRAYDSTAERIRQAQAGNAGRGTVVLAGTVGAAS